MSKIKHLKKGGFWDFFGFPPMECARWRSQRLDSNSRVASDQKVFYCGTSLFLLWYFTFYCGTSLFTVVLHFFTVVLHFKKLKKTIVLHRRKCTKNINIKQEKFTM